MFAGRQYLRRCNRVVIDIHCVVEKGRLAFFEIERPAAKEPPLSNDHSLRTLRWDFYIGSDGEGAILSFRRRAFGDASVAVVIGKMCAISEQAGANAGTHAAGPAVVDWKHVVFRRFGIKQ